MLSCVEELDVEPRGGECPDCEHVAGMPSGQPWYVRLFRMRPQPAACNETIFGDAGLSEPCGCDNHFHGS